MVVSGSPIVFASTRPHSSPREAANNIESSLILTGWLSTLRRNAISIAAMSLTGPAATECNAGVLRCRRLAIPRSSDSSQCPPEFGEPERFPPGAGRTWRWVLAHFEYCSLVLRLVCYICALLSIVQVLRQSRVDDRRPASRELWCVRSRGGLPVGRAPRC